MLQPRARTPRVETYGPRQGRGLAGALLLLIALGCAPDGEQNSEATRPPVASDAVVPPSPSTEPLQGLDVSHFNGDVDWPAVATSGQGFAWIKATEGEDYVDPRFHQNWQGAAAAGLPRGAYHFFRPEDDPETQARFFLETVNHAAGDLLPALDLETADGVDSAELVADALIWLRIVGEAVGCSPLVYTDTSFWDGLDSELLGDFPLWLAEYEVDSPTLPEGWEEWTLWQHTQTGTVDGVIGDVDLGLLAGGEAAFPDMRLGSCR